MPRVREINVLADLKTLSEECDKLAEDTFKNTDLGAWAEEVKQVIIKIRDCPSKKELQEIKYPPSITSFLGTNTNKESSEKTKEEVGVHIEKVHEEKQATVSNEAADKSLENEEDKKSSAVVNHTPCNKIAVEVVPCKLPKFEDCNKLLSSVGNHTPCDKVTVPKGSLTVVKKPRLMPSFVPPIISNSVKKYDEKVNSSVLSSASKHTSVLLQQTITPVNMDATFVKNDSEGKNKSVKPQLNLDETFVKSVRKESVLATETPNSGKTSEDKNKSMKPQPNLDETFVKSVREDSKTESVLTVKTPNLNETFNKIADGTVVIDSSQKSKILNAISHSGVLTRSGSKKMMVATPENIVHLAAEAFLNMALKKTASEAVVIESGQKSSVLKESTCGILTRSGSKKKITSTSENHAGDGKAAHSGGNDMFRKRKSSPKNSSNKKQKLSVRETPKKPSKAKKPPLKKNNSKSGPVIVPTVQSKPSVLSKEQQMLEEIKKKEDKVKSNIKRVMEERQQKAELNKKNLEEKRKKALEKRNQIEKEKEERLKLESQGIKLFKSHAESDIKKIKTRELTENDGKENKSMVSDSVKQNDTYCVAAAAVAKTPVTKKSHNSDCYELTPTYNSSDDEDTPSHKPIPKWAHGVPLKSALMQQYYNPLDPADIFGTVLEDPDLAEIFKTNKPGYKKRTSSAIWNSSFRF